LIDIAVYFTQSVVAHSPDARITLNMKVNAMPISEDLKSVHIALADLARSVSADTAPVIRSACANLLALAEQVEALETMPLSLEHAMPRLRLAASAVVMQ
jgi:hypothetical protein